MNRRSNINNVFQQVEKQIFMNYSYLPKMLGYSVIDDPDITMIKCGFKTLSFNIICNTNPHVKEYDLLLKKVQQNYGKTPYAWWLSLNNSNDFGLFLENKGLVKVSSEKAMIYDLSKFNDFELVDGLDIQLATSLKHLQDYSEVLKNFENDINSFYINKAIISKAVMGKTNLFIGYIRGKPVSTGSMFFNDDLVSLHDLVTVKEHRDKGIGISMVKYRINEAKKKKFKKICTSSNSTIFQQLGFENIGEFSCYISS